MSIVIRYAVDVVMAVLILGCLTYTLGGGPAARRKAASIIGPRTSPRPDYSLIAAMEREVYGEAFKHDGAPEQAGILVADPGSVVIAGNTFDQVGSAYGITMAEFSENVRDLHRLMAGVPAVSMLCKGCGSPMSYARRYCLKCYRMHRRGDVS